MLAREGKGVGLTVLYVHGSGRKSHAPAATCRLEKRILQKIVKSGCCDREASASRRTCISLRLRERIPEVRLATFTQGEHNMMHRWKIRDMEFPVLGLVVEYVYFRLLSAKVCRYQVQFVACTKSFFLNFLAQIVSSRGCLLAREHILHFCSQSRSLLLMFVPIIEAL